MTGNVKFVVVPGSILQDRSLNAGSKLLYGLLRFYQGQKGYCWPGLDRLAAELHVDRSTVKRSIKKLVAAELLSVERRYRKSSVYRVDDRVDEDFLLVSSAAMSAQITPAAKILFSYLNYRMGENGETWPHQKRIASDLGMSKATVCRTVADLEKSHALRVQHAHGGKKQGNRYQTTLKLFKGAKCGTRLESGASKRTPNNNTSKEVKRKSPKNFSQRALSTPADLAYRRLTWVGVHPKVAHSIVYELRHPPESVEAAIENAKTREVSVRANHKAFSRPGYIVASLNKARRECHTVNLSPAARQEHKRVMILTENIKRSKCRTIPESEKQQKLKAMKAALFAAEKIAI